MSDKTPSATKPQKKSGKRKSDLADKRAANLRVNLKRRKAQAKERTAEEKR